MIISLAASDYTIYSIFLVCLLYLILCVQEYIYIQLLCTDGAIIDMRLHLLLVAVCTVCYRLGISLVICVCVNIM